MEYFYKNEFILYAIIIFHVVFRLLYVFSLGNTIKKAIRFSELQTFANWKKFKTKAKWILNLDGISFFILTVITYFSESWILGNITSTIIGLLLIYIGLNIKYRSIKNIGIEGYYWRQSFMKPKKRNYDDDGIYKYLENPMYGLGYAHVFGFAILMQSCVGFYMAFFDWAAVWYFYQVYEKNEIES